MYRGCMYFINKTKYVLVKTGKQKSEKVQVSTGFKII